MFTNIMHIAYNTKNLDAMLDFYCGKLGLTKAFALYNQDGSVWIQYVKIAHDQFIEFFNDQGTEVDNAPIVRYNHLSLQTDDIIAEVERIRAAGVPIQYEVAQGSDNSYQAWIVDPDGNRVELMQLTEKSLQRADY